MVSFVQSGPNCIKLVGRLRPPFRSLPARSPLKASEAGSYEVTDGDVFFSSVSLRAKLEGKTLTLTELAAPKGEGAYTYNEEDGAYHKADDPSVIEVPDKAVLVLEKK